MYRYGNFDIFRECLNLWFSNVWSNAEMTCDQEERDSPMPIVQAERYVPLHLI